MGILSTRLLPRGFRNSGGEQVADPRDSCLMQHDVCAVARLHAGIAPPKSLEACALKRQRQLRCGLCSHRVEEGAPAVQEQRGRLALGLEANRHTLAHCCQECGRPGWLFPRKIWREDFDMELAAREDRDPPNAFRAPSLLLQDLLAAAQVARE